MVNSSSKNKDALSERAYREIMQRIITFQYKPNEVIIEADMCNELNVSRTPLREALRRLESEGFVVKIRNQGTFVRPFTEKDIVEICDYRKLLEVYSLHGCVEFASDDDLKNIEINYLADLERSEENNYFCSDLALHAMITRYCENSRMLHTLDSLSTQIEFIRKIAAKASDRRHKSPEEHINILKAIQDRDIDLATRYLEAHLDGVKESCLQVFRKMQMENSYGG